MSPIIPGLSHCSASPQFSSTGQFSSSAEGYNSVYENSDYYNYNNYPGKSPHMQSTGSNSDLYVECRLPQFCVGEVGTEDFC